MPRRSRVPVALVVLAGAALALAGCRAAPAVPGDVRDGYGTPIAAYAYTAPQMTWEWTSTGQRYSASGAPEIAQRGDVAVETVAMAGIPALRITEPGFYRVGWDADLDEVGGFVAEPDVAGADDPANEVVDMVLSVGGKVQYPATQVLTDWYGVGGYAYVELTAAEVPATVTLSVMPHAGSAVTKATLTGEIDLRIERYR